MHPVRLIAAILALLVAGPCLAQLTTSEASAPGCVYKGTAVSGKDMLAPCQVPVDPTGKAYGPTNPLIVAGRQEVFILAAANVAAPAVTLYGGDYVVTQGCAAYGTVTIRYRGPDGATMLTILTKTSTDSGGGTLQKFGSAAIVDATLAGTTGCNVQIARVPQ